MGSGSSCLAATVAPLNATTTDEDGSQGLLDKLSSQPALLSKPVPGLSLLLGGVAQTWMHVACERKQVQVVQRMLDFLASSSISAVREALGPYCRRTGAPLPESAAEGLRLAVGMCNGRGQTPLMHAGYAGCAALVNLLLDKGADPWVADKCGCRTALHYAAIAGCARCVAALLRSSAAQRTSQELWDMRYVNVTSRSGLTPLHYAVYYERHEVLRELLRHEPDINAATSGPADDCGDAWWLYWEPASTPLHFAAARGNATAVIELLGYYAARRHSGYMADPRAARTTSGKQPWHLAAAQYPSLRYLGVVLHPGQPLTRVVGGSDGAQNPNIGAPSLSSIAAAALRQKLLAEVAAAESETAAVPPPPQQQPTTLMSSDAVASRGSECSDGGEEAEAEASKAGWGWPLVHQATSPGCRHGGKRLSSSSSRNSSSSSSSSSSGRVRAGASARLRVPPLAASTAIPTAALLHASPLAPPDCSSLSDLPARTSSGRTPRRLLPALSLPAPGPGPAAPGHPLRTSADQRPSQLIASPASCPSVASRPASPLAVQPPLVASKPSCNQSPRELGSALGRHPFGVGDPEVEFEPVPEPLEPCPLPAGAAADGSPCTGWGRQVPGALATAAAAPEPATQPRPQPPPIRRNPAYPASWRQEAGDCDGPRPRSPSQSAPLQHLPAEARPVAAAAAAVCFGVDLAEGGGDGGDITCSLCFARRRVVAPVVCRHSICAACARELCHGLTARPLLCPFCRRPVSELVRVASPPPRLPPPPPRSSECGGEIAPSPMGPAAVVAGLMPPLPPQPGASAQE